MSDLPTVDFPTITVNASLPGASPETMASAVATPLEKQFSTIAGIDNMTSTSGLGSTLDHDPVLARPEHRRRGAGRSGDDRQDAASNLPPGIIPPSYQKVNPADQPIVFYGFTSTLMPISQLDEYAETFMAQRISMIPGVAQVNVYGSAKYAVRMQLDPNALAQPADRHRRSRGRDQRRRTSICRRACSTARTRRTRSRRTASSQDAASFRRLVVTYRNGAPVHLGDLGQVLDDIQNNRSIAWFAETGRHARRHPRHSASARHEHRRRRRRGEARR